MWHSPSKIWHKDYFIQNEEFGDSPLDLLDLSAAFLCRRTERVTWLPIPSHIKNVQVLMEVHWACKPLVSLSRKWFYTVSVGMQVWKHWLCVLHPYLCLLFIDWGCRKKCTLGLSGEASSIRNNPGSSEKLQELQMLLLPTFPAFQFKPLVWFGTCRDAQPAPGHPGCLRLWWCSPVQ